MTRSAFRLIRIAPLVVGLATHPTGAAQAQDAGMRGMQGVAESARPTSADQAFIDMMTPHHQQAIAMSQRAVSQATHLEVRQKAQQMIEMQRQEIAQMKGWRRKWFGSDSTPPPMMSADLPAGPDFDRMFLTEMFKHHGMGVATAAITVRSSARREIKDLARKTSDSQHKDQHQFAIWLHEWYGAPAPGAPAPTGR